MHVQRNHVKFVANVITGAGVSKVVGDIIRNNTTVETKSDWAKVAIGSGVLGSMIADKATEHVFTKIDNVANWWEARKELKSEEQPES